jgi:magnesium-transporting ATPase (P-type)
MAISTLFMGTAQSPAPRDSRHSVPDRATEALRRLMPVYARVLRQGQEQRLLAEELVPGDVIVLAEGDHISADARLIQEAELRVDQSTLTGESHPVRKTSQAVQHNNLAYIELPNLIFAGTNVITGTAKAVVFATGMESEFGKIAYRVDVALNQADLMAHLIAEEMSLGDMMTLLKLRRGVFQYLGRHKILERWSRGFSR